MGPSRRRCRCAARGARRRRASRCEPRAGSPLRTPIEIGNGPARRARCRGPSPAPWRRTGAGRAAEDGRTEAATETASSASSRAARGAFWARGRSTFGGRRVTMAATTTGTSGSEVVDAAAGEGSVLDTANWQPVLQLVHVTDMHVKDVTANPDHPLQGSRRAFARFFKRYAQKTDDWDDGTQGHYPLAPEAFARFLIRWKARFPEWSDVPVWLVDTGDRTAFGDVASMQAGERHLAQWKAALGGCEVRTLFGNHDAWPGTQPGLALGGIAADAGCPATGLGHPRLVEVTAQRDAAVGYRHDPFVRIEQCLLDARVECSCGRRGGFGVTTSARSATETRRGVRRARPQDPGPTPPGRVSVDRQRVTQGWDSAPNAAQGRRRRCELAQQQRE